MTRAGWWPRPFSFYMTCPGFATPVFSLFSFRDLCRFGGARRREGLRGFPFLGYLAFLTPIPVQIWIVANPRGSGLVTEVEGRNE